MRRNSILRTFIVKSILGIVCAVSLILVPSALLAQEDDYPLPEPPNIEGGFSEPLNFYGNYCGGFGGVSLHDELDQTFEIDLVGTPLRAYFVWSGRAQGWNAAGDDTILIGINGGALQSVTADGLTQTASRSDSNFTWFTYAAEATAQQLALLQNGTNTVQATGLEINENHGVGLLVLTEDLDRCPFQAIGLFFGNDVLFHGWTDTSGPNSQVTCLDFPPPPDPVEIDIQMFVGGVENPLRSNAIWAETGDGGSQPDDLVGRATATRLIQPLRGLSGDEFDNYDTLIQDPQPIIAQPGDTWACFQIESPPEPFPDKTQGISATWINLAVRVPVAEIAIEPSGVNPIGVEHTFTVTVHSAFGYPQSLLITPTVEPAPDVMTDTCDTPTIIGQTATCTIMINSSVPGTFTATAEAKIELNDMVAYISTNGVRESSGPAIKVYEAPPAIDLEKATNDEDADSPTGPFIKVGDPVEWTYVVHNIGPITLENVLVVDDQGVAVVCPQETLAPDAIMTCKAEGVATEGQYANLGSVTAVSTTGVDVEDQDPSHYFGQRSAIDIEKATNGEDADNPTGPLIVIGDPVVWTYAVENTGNLTLTQVTVTDDRGVDVDCPKETLIPGEVMVCQANGVADLGQYANTGEVVGTDPTGEQVTDSDPGHYLGIKGSTDIDDVDEPIRAERQQIFVPLMIGR